MQDELINGSFDAGSEIIRDLVLKVRPRYHIAATNGHYYDRPPYLNKDLGAGLQALPLSSSCHISVWRMPLCLTLAA